MGGRIALVTGGSRGIGRAVALALAGSGHRVAVSFSSDQAGADDTCAAIEALGTEAIALQADAADPTALDAAFGQVEAAWGKVEVLVANAGVTGDGLALRMTDDQWNRVLRTNLDGAFYAMRRAMPGMVRARWGRMIAMGSVVRAERRRRTGQLRGGQGRARRADPGPGPRARRTRRDLQRCRPWADHHGHDRRPDRCPEGRNDGHGAPRPVRYA